MGENGASREHFGILELQDHFVGARGALGTSKDASERVEEKYGSEAVVYEENQKFKKGDHFLKYCKVIQIQKSSNSLLGPTRDRFWWNPDFHDLLKAAR